MTSDQEFVIIEDLLIDIEPMTPIDYQIRFQNTGTDTAFTVVIRDTLSSWLDVESFKVGISDHTFRTDFEGSNILKFTFDHILLPDSNVNEAAFISKKAKLAVEYGKFDESFNAVQNKI